MSRCKSLFVFAALAVAAAAPAQSVAKSGSFYKSVGNSYLGGSLYGSASMYASTTRAKGYARLNVKGKLLGYRREIAEFQKYVNTTSSAVSGKFGVRLAGYTINLPGITSAGSITRTLDRRRNLFPRDLTKTFTVWIVPVTVKANLGLRLQARGSLSVYPLSARASGFATASVYGWASGQAGWSGWGAGARITANFGNPKVEGLIYARGGRSPRLFGLIRFCYQAVSVKLKVFAEAFWKEVSKTVASWSTAKRCLPNLLDL